MHKATCSDCGKPFTAATQSQAKAAVTMHRARVHLGTLPVPGQRRTGTEQPTTKGATMNTPLDTRHKITTNEKEAVVRFLIKNEDDYATKTLCLRAAFDAAGIGDRLICNSSAANRFFNYVKEAKAEARVAAATPAAEEAEAETVPATDTGRRGRLPGSSNLTEEEKQKLIQFIKENRSRFGAASKCFVAGLAANGLDGKLAVNTANITRYTRLALNGSSFPGAPRSHEVEVNFCPRCGCNLHGVAVGMAAASLGQH